MSSDQDRPAPFRFPLPLLLAVLAAGCTAAAPAATATPGAAVDTPQPTTTPPPTDRPTATPQPTGPVAAVGGRVTLTETSCHFERGVKPEPGTVSFELRNTTDQDAGFDLFRVREESSFEDVAAHIATENSRVTDGLPPLGFPSSAEHKSQTAVEPEAEAVMEAQAGAGTWGLVCIVAAGPDPRAFFLVGPFELDSP